MTEKRFTISIDSNDLKSLWDDERTEEEPLLWLTRSDRIGGIDDVCKLLNELHDKNEQLKLDLKVANDGADLYKDINEALEKENEQLKQDKKRLIGYLHRYGFIDVEDVDEIILNKEYLDEWGELYNDER